MAAQKYEKVKSTPFSNFIRYASVDDKSKFFSQVVKATIKDQQAMVAKAEAVNKQ